MPFRLSARATPRIATLLALFAMANAASAQSLWQWAKANDGGDNEFVRDMAVDTINDFVYTVGAYDNGGILLGIGASGLDGFITKADLNGNVQWSQRIGSSGQDAALGVAVGANGNVYVTGYYANSAFLTFPAVVPGSTSGGVDMYLACFSPAGAVQWVRTGGGVENDMGVSVGVNATGVFVQAMYRGTATFSGSASTNVFNTGGHSRSTVLKYSLAGALQWQLNGGCGSNGNKEVEPERLACDANGVYVTGSFQTTQMSWYNPTNTLLQTLTATGDPNGYVCSINNAGTFLWSQVISNPGSDHIAANAIAVGCSGVYIAGSSHNNSVFPGGVTVSAAGAPHDYAYIVSLQPTTGTTQWVRTVRGPENHLTVGYDLAVHKNGSLLLCGSFKGSATFTDGTVINTSGGGGYKLDGFVARYSPYGQMEWASVHDGSEDNVPMAIALDRSSGIYVGGAFKDELFMPPLAFSSNGNSNYYWGKFTDSSLNYWPANPTNWIAPAQVCANSAPINLNATLPAFTQGFVDAALDPVGVVNQNNIVGAPNGTTVVFTTNGWSVTADLTDTIPTGSTYVIRWAKNAAVAGTAALTLEASVDNATWTPVTTAPSISPTTAAFVNSVVQANVNTRYLRISKTATSAAAFRVDAIKFYSGSQAGGAWSGTGVIGSTFTPSAAGSFPVTYTVQFGNCGPHSTTKNINVLPLPVGGSITASVSGMLCPNSNSGTLTLAGNTGNILEWQRSIDNFATHTVVANTLATLTFSNLSQTTSYRARISNSCGTVLSTSHTVQVGDNIAPTITTCPSAQTIYVGGACTAPLPNLLASAAGSDNCSTALTWTQSPGAGTPLAKGTHIVTITATDASGNSTTCNVTITAADNTAPVISGCPANVTRNADPGMCSAIHNFTPPTANDNCGAVVTASSLIANVNGIAVTTLNAPNEYPVGVTTRTFTFTDASGNTSTCSFTITVIDNQWPTMATCPSDITVPATPGLCGAAVTYALPTFSDNCLYRIDRTQGLASGDVFPVGTTAVKHLATDSAGHSVSCTFNVIVQDVQPPVLTGCPSNFIVQAPLAGTGANATWTAPIATDNCGVATVAQTGGQIPGSFFTIGTHTITYTATASNGGTSTCSFSITIISNDAPTIVCPTNQVLYSTPITCAQIFTYPVPPVGDDVPLPAGQPVQIDGTGYTSGSAFPLGTTVQTWRVTDSNANSTTCSFSVQVIDTIRPSFTSCPGSVTISAEPSECGAHFTYAVPIATDNCIGAIGLVRLIGPASGSLFPIGSTLVRYRAMDPSGNAMRCQFNVTVVDDVFPTLNNCPTDITVNAEANACGAHVSFPSPLANDNCLASLTLTDGLPSGTLFPIGDTPVEFTATDPTGNSVTCGFNVHVDDATPPAFTYCPDTLTVTSDPGQCGAAVNYAPPLANDNCTAALNPPPGQTSGSFFPVGTTSVSYSATDGISTTSCTFQIVVIDNEAPEIVGLPANISASTDPSDSTATVSWTAPTASDNCATTIAGDHLSGEVFDIGTTAVTYTAADGVHSASATFLITVTDEEDPVITCPANDTLLVDATCSVAMPFYAATATDNHAIDSIWQAEGPLWNDPLMLSGAPYYAKWVAVDAAGNITTCLQWIELIDGDAPVITCLWPAPIELNADEDCAAIVPALNAQQTYDDCSAVTVDQDPAPGTVIYGDTVITTTVTDAFGNISTTTDLVHLLDTIPPQHDALPDTMELDIEYWMPLCHAHIPDLYPLLNSTDGCSGISYEDQTPPPNTDFVVSPQWVFIEIGDNAGNIAKDSVWVIPTDVEAPLLDCSLAGPIDLPGNADCEGIVPNVLAGVSVDECYLEDFFQTPAAGTVINGDVSVLVTAVDSAGNVSTCTVDILLTDTMAPVFNCVLSMSFTSDPGSCGTVVTLPSGAAVDTLIADNCDPSPTWSQIGGPASGFFPVDTTWITYEATDASGNTATCLFSVIVSGETLPALNYGGSQFCTTGGALVLSPPMPSGGSFECSTCTGGIDGDGAIDLSAVGVGTHVISYINACTVPDSIGVTITVTAPPSASISYPTAPFCTSDGPQAATIVGSSSGTFSSPTGLVFNNTATGEVAPASSPVATHTVNYTVLPAMGCPGTTASTTVQVVGASSATIDYVDSLYCNTSGTVPAVCTGSASGTYSSSPVGGLGINGATGAFILGPGTQAGTHDITYTIPANAACPAFATTDRIVVHAPVNAGTDNTIVLCVSAPATNLFTLLGPSAQAGGQWFKPFQGYAPFTGIVTPSSYPTGGNFTYAYVVFGTPPCVNDTAWVTVTYNVAANAGTNGTLTVCALDTARNLFAQLGGTPDPGGLWAGPSAVIGGQYVPASMNPGFYTYTVLGTAPCPNASAIVTVAENAAVSWYEDVDADGTGDPLNSIISCAQPIGYVPNNTDPCPLVAFAIPNDPCDDNDASTGNDIYQANCTCAGQLIDCLGITGGTALPGTPCDDGIATTGNDTYQANCTCAGQFIDCLGTPGGTALPGTPCDDGIATTGNDIYLANCSCAGQLVDCLGMPGGTALPGTPCNDGIATTGNDVYLANCSCAGQLIDCLGIPGGAALPGTPCNDGIATTGGDLYQANCTCAGQLIDCLGVPGGTALPGTPCNDGLATTGNDTYQANCSCAGQLIDCLGVPGGTALPGTPCNDGLATTGNDTYQANCSCAGQLIDCLGVPGGIALPGTPCDDGIVTTGNDIYMANCSCAGQLVDCLGMPGGTALPGTPCDDGIVTTGNDIYMANCSCAGQLIDCLGVPGGTALPGTPCNDGLATTGNDIYMANCSCAGQLIDCLGVPGGTALPGTPCNDGLATTGNDTYQANCSCAGQLIDCLGTPGGTALPGTPCNDGLATTGNDTYQANCSCAGQLIDCLGVPGGAALPGTPCDDGLATTGNDIYQANCSCAGQLIDCLGTPGGTALPGTPCNDGLATTGNDTYQANCSCAGQLIDCLGVPGGAALPGTPCDDGLATTGNDIYMANCSCAGQLIDCLGIPGGAALPGTPCNDGIATTGNDVYLANCSCAGQLIDCLGIPGGAALPGTPCDDGIATTGNDTYQANCSCAGQLIDCLGTPGGTALPGTPCDDGIATTGNDVYLANCSCAGQLIDCLGVPGGAALPGTPCDDGIATTGNDTYQANCSCAGQLIDCLGTPGGTALPGTPCDDGIATTGNDTYQANCSCAGQLIDCLGVPGGAALPGTPCDDGLATTGNDIYMANCSCAGQLIDCLGVPGGTALPGTPCDDGIATTGNDTYQANCSCAGQLIDCLGVPGGAALPGTPCDDGLATTGNDIYMANCSCAGQLIDCLGVPGGAALPGTPCDDGIATTGNDVYLANCSCAGQLIDCLGMPGGTALPGTPCDDGIVTTGNDIYLANCSCAGQLIDCLGMPGGTALPGTPCDDGIVTTGNDIYMANCSCAGQLIDCLGVAGGTALPGTPCNDGFATTGNDTYQANCSCAGQLIDCLGIPGGIALPGTPCDDGLATTGNDIYQPNCTCAGQLIDCLGVAGGTALPGTPCDDGIVTTGNDIYLANCSCAGQLIDCLNIPGGAALPGTPCDDGLATTGNDTYQANCTCAGQLIDCLGVPGGAALPGTPCDDGIATTGNDIYLANCSCAGQLIDCEGMPGGSASPGTTCDDLNPLTGDDTYDANCICVGQVIDCSGLVGGTDLPGTPCDDGIATTGNDVWSAACLCQGELIDCAGVPGGTDLPGTPCDDALATTVNDTWDVNCACSGQPIDCLGTAGGTALPGTPCDDGLATTGNDIYQPNCTCAGQLIDCLGIPGGAALPGTPCNDGIATTGGDLYQANCTCAGQLIDCLGVPGGTALPGTSCDDGIATTGNDIYLANCSCAGQLIDCLGVPGGAALPGTPCDDALATTGNDTWDVNCACSGQPIDCQGTAGGTALPGTPCDDGLATTGNDIYQPNCTCAGQLIDCLGIPGGAALPGTPCNDGIATTGGDLYQANCTCAGQLIDCLGVPGGTALPGTSCDDGIATTGNDIYLANCSCAGQLIDCLGVPGGAALPGTPCDDALATTGNDTWDVNCACSGQPIDCQGTAGGTALPGTPCDDGFTTTGNDIYLANCSCAGQLIDCLGVPGGAALPGTPCDDALATTGNDTWDVNCACSGQPIDCQGTTGGTALPGTPCDDGIATTGNDTWDVNCACSGQPIDCLGTAGGTALPGTPCDDGIATTGNDTWDVNCVCSGQPIDCMGASGGTALPGTPCDDGIATTGNDSWDVNCACSGQLIDCLGVSGGPALTGTACDDGDPDTGNDAWNVNCTCTGQLIDCLGIPGGASLPGTGCDDGDACTSGDFYDTNCTCIGTPITCDDGDPCTIDSCDPILGCQFTPAADGDGDGVCDAIDNCPTVFGQIGSPCNDNSACTTGDVIDASCNCVGTAITCDDGDPCTIDSCDPILGCQFIPAADGDGDGVCDAIDNCPTVFGQIGSPCNDNSACTTGDVIDASCNCVGTAITCDDGDPCTVDSCDPILGCQFIPAADGDGDGVCDAIDNCPTVLGQIGSPCNDNSACTTGDVIDASCNCVGTAITCDDGDPCTVDSCDPILGCQFIPAADGDGDGVCDAIDNCPTVFGQIGSPCNDNSACTTGDVIDASCNCVGTPAVHDAAFAYSAAAYCLNSSDPLPWIAEQGGVFSAVPSGIVINAATGELDLDMSLPNTYTVSYTVGDSCGSTSTQEVTLSAPPNASWNHPGPICITQGTMDLSTLITGALGGTWTGDGVIGSGFDPTVGLGAHDLTYTVILGPCTASVSQTVLVNPGPYADAGPDTVVCGLTAQMQAVLLQAGGTWSSLASLQISAPGDPNAWVTATLPGTYTLLWTVGTTPCIATDTVNITFHDPNEPLWVNAGGDQQLAVITSTELNGQGTDGVQFLWSVLTGNGSVVDPTDPGSAIGGLSQGTNALLLTAALDGCGLVTDTMVITVLDLFIPQGFSPNGDGVNDRFEITGIDAYPGNELKVFDRWGRPVMHATDYDNSWDGRGTSGVPLLDDTYFYVLNLSDGLTYNGYLIIKR